MIAAGGGGTLCLILLGKFFIPVLWKLKYLSLGDFYYERYGKTTGAAATLLICITYISWVATNVVIFGKILHPLIGWDVETAIWLGILVLTIYTVLGGMFAVCYTDVVQVILMGIGFAVLVPITVNVAGGLTEVLQSTPESMKSILPQEGAPWLPWFAAWLIIGIGGLNSPDLAQRSFTAKSASVAQKSFYLAAALYLIFEVGVLLIGYSGRVLAEKGLLDAALLAEDAELIMPIVIKTLLPLPISIMFFGAVIAGVMGASDSALMAMSAVLSKNIYNDLFKPDASDKDMIRVTRILIVLMAILAGLLATSYPRVLELSLYAFDLMLACLVAPFIFGFYFKQSNGIGAVAAMIVGFLFRTLGAAITNEFSFEGIVYPLNWYIFTIGAPALSSATLVIVSLLTQKINAPLKIDRLEEIRQGAA
jgi:SSS family transporter